MIFVVRMLVLFFWIFLVKEVGVGVGVEGEDGECFLVGDEGCLVFEGCEYEDVDGELEECWLFLLWYLLLWWLY